MKPPLLELRQVSKRFEKKPDLAARFVRALGGTAREETVHAVDRVDLQVHDGAVVGLVGESGCGKSTLARLVAGLHTPSEGEILWDSHRLQGPGHGGAPGRAAADADDLSGPICVAEPAAARGRPGGRGAGGARAGAARAARRVGGRAAAAASGWTPHWRAASRTSSAGASVRAWASHGRWRCSRAS